MLVGISMLILASGINPMLLLKYNTIGVALDLPTGSCIMDPVE